MILACPRCGRRYRVDPDRLPAPGQKVRCPACREVFEAGPPAPEAVAAPKRPAVPGVSPPAGAAPPPPGAPLALVADEAREFRDLVRRTLEALGCRVEATDDGEAAFRFAVSRRPRIMILNVYLRRLLGVAVCEGVKGSPDLRATRVALVGSVFKSDRFIRSPGNLYGADDYFEDVIPARELRERLGGLLRGGASPAGGRPGATDPLAEPAAPPLPEEGIHGRLDPQAEIRRLARIMISDLRIYHPEEFPRAVRERRVFETFREELTKGKELITHRFPDLPERIEILAAALREGIDQERGAGRSVPAGPGA